MGSTRANVALTDDRLVAAVRTGLRDAADPGRAPQMQAYMKSSMPYYGVRMPDVRALTRSLLADADLHDAAAWEATIRALYDGATHREERYAALTIAADRRYRAFATRPSLALWKHLIVTGAWWDLVDDTSHRVGDVLLAHRTRTTASMRAWSVAGNLWLRRTSVICQLGHGDATDLALLTDVIDSNAADGDFFIRKAIGWALREYARVDPNWVLATVRAREDRLSPLSRREALKHLSGV